MCNTSSERKRLLPAAVVADMDDINGATYPDPLSYPRVNIGGVARKARERASK